ncbi:HalOD1 output domain-containing protein [Halorussus litoreus]|uniref:HalOD1 output domain-containing protein n=1 Tax=Halorussus litoreus TaxID=1710536 RepID=UPI000E26CC1E|nr:HalOD1 output domain-containing protein [Halorussus litoreus]
MIDDSDSRLGRVEHDPTTGTYYTNHAGEDAPPSAVVPNALAEITDRRIESLRPLQQVVDPDALDQVFDESAVDDADEVDVSFVYVGFEVNVSSSGVIVLEPVDDEE